LRTAGARVAVQLTNDSIEIGRVAKESDAFLSDAGAVGTAPARRDREGRHPRRGKAALSAMPEDLAKKPEQKRDLRDLVAYLSSLR